MRNCMGSMGSARAVGLGWIRFAFVREGGNRGKYIFMTMVVCLWGMMMMVLSG